MSIKRFWHCWVSPTRADACENLLRDEMIPGIDKNAVGRLQDVIDFQGEDYTRSYVPYAVQKVIARRDERASHFEIRESLHYV